MLRTFGRAVLLIIIIIIMSCQKPPGKIVPPPAGGNEKIAVVQVEWENVRETPNGRIIGRALKGDTLTVLDRKGNWIRFSSPWFEEGYIWGPSVGLPYLNIYHPSTYFDTTRSQFRTLEEIQQILGDSGAIVQDEGKIYKIFFSELGLGEHTETVLEVVTESKEVVEHGIHLFVEKSTDRIVEVKVDFRQPINGYPAALEKCHLPNKPPTESNNGHLLWAADVLVPGLIVDLERKEWDSDWFSAVRYRLPAN